MSGFKPAATCFASLYKANWRECPALPSQDGRGEDEDGEEEGDEPLCSLVPAGQRWVINGLCVSIKESNALSLCVFVFCLMQRNAAVTGRCLDVTNITAAMLLAGKRVIIE